MTIFVLFAVALFGLSLPQRARRLWYVVAATVLLMSQAHAEEYRNFTLVDIPPGEDVIMALKKGQPSPFDGQVFDIRTALRWSNWLQQYRDWFEVEGDRQKSLCELDVRFYEELHSVELYRSEQLNADLTQRLKRSEGLRLQAEHDLSHPPWYESRLFWFAIGAVTVGGFGIAVATAL